ncbi:hypothetical protein AEM51_03710 [Bacteroidetes bacterium UKL13-3]|nr:hypothetical protein AEM51_03710 [Bacteroidetes bacterium UKL13-3]HCP94705.1 hypothetical protein [Bacteroidota bacterium]
MNAQNITYSVKYFKKTYFENIKGYNKLMIAPSFYKAFKMYTFILIYQLDAFVFRDELKDWCNKGYSYIGAPWIVKKNGLLEFDDTGNGGLSLRKVRDHIKALHSFSYIVSPKKLVKEYFQPKRSFKAYLQLSFKLVKQLISINNTYYLLNDYKFHEDYFWCKVVAKNFNWFKVPKAEEALKFSFELEPSYLFHLNNDQLPFGCHAWEKYEPDFWISYIRARTI